MANILVNEGKYELLKGTFGDISSGTTIKLALVNSSIGSVTATSTYSSVSGNIVAGSTVSLSGKTITNNVFTASNPTISGVSSGISVKGYIVYFDNGSIQRLIGFVDTGTGLPFTTNGGNITITFSGSGIFAL